MPFCLPVFGMLYPASFVSYLELFDRIFGHNYTCNPNYTIHF